MRQKYQSAEMWAQSKCAGFPERWRKRLLATWSNGVNAAQALPRVSGEGGCGHAVWSAGRELCDITEKLQRLRLNLNASDAEVCECAAETAKHCFLLAGVFHEVEYLRFSLNRICWSVGVCPAGVRKKETPGGVEWVRSKRMKTGAAIARMTNEFWWRAALRKLLAVSVESAAIKLGYVNKAKDLYVSNESLARRQQQIRRNAAMMESTIMQNELDQEFKLSELAAKGTANKAIRRGELMTRIAGFEKIAIECGHAGLFLTVTCPSRMHKFTAGNGRVFDNPKYDGTTPKEAQAYMSKCYARTRAKLARHGAGVYGFRIAEPHHDGCPHWHILLFCEGRKLPWVEYAFCRYFMADSSSEKGAAQHRVVCLAMDASKGTAAGYIAKYVAKNIDGLHVEKDLYGNPAMETSMRVEAWASTWGIRQFQQVGGAPVGVWRELRRVREIPDGAPEHLKAAHVAVNKIEGAGDGEEAKQADWEGYVKAQGGVFCGRNAAIKLAKESTGEIGRYGEPIAPAPIGVETVGREVYRDGIIPDRVRFVEWLVQSVRHVWRVVKGRVSAAVSSPPWTCVNNCTREVKKNVREFGGRLAGGGGVKLFAASGVCESTGGGGDFASNWFRAGAFG